jgi:large subunit ribosomal protein L18
MKRIDFRRKREGKTDYRRRLRLLMSNKLRLIVRLSLKNIVVQFAEYDEKGDKILVGASSSELNKKFGWNAGRNNLPASYLTGYLAGKKAAKKGLKEAVLDIGLMDSIGGGKIYAALKGVLDAGLNIPCSEEVLPDENSVKGMHIVEYAKKLLKEDKDKYNKLFSSYIKKGIKPEDLAKYFDDTKKKIG